MIIFKNKHFSRWAAKEGLADKSLTAAVQEMDAGLIDSNLGGGVFKKRVATQGGGKERWTTHLAGLQER